MWIAGLGVAVFLAAWLLPMRSAAREGASR